MPTPPNSTADYMRGSFILREALLDVIKQHYQVATNNQGEAGFEERSIITILSALGQLTAIFIAGVAETKGRHEATSHRESWVDTLRRSTKVMMEDCDP